MYGVSESGSSTPHAHAAINHDYITSKKNNYTARPPCFSGDSTEFEWWKSKTHTHIIGIDDDLWDIMEDGIDIPVNGVRMVSNRKTFTPAQKRSIKNIIELKVSWFLLYLILSTSKSL